MLVNLIDGAGKDTIEWHAQWDVFDQKAAKLRAPVFYAGGNHDLTGNLASFVWNERYGRPYYHFIYKNSLFMILNTEDYTSERNDEIEELRTEAVKVYKEEGINSFLRTEYAKLPERKYGNISKEQSDYFVKVIEENPNVNWTFLIIHKPIWQGQNLERFNSIESVLSPGKYTVFYGHTHLYQTEKRNGSDYINLATTGGEQFPEKGRSMDHLLWVTVDSAEVTIANLLMEGILDKSGHIPLGGDSLEFEKTILDRISPS